MSDLIYRDFSALNNAAGLAGKAAGAASSVSKLASLSNPVTAGLTAALGVGKMVSVRLQPKCSTPI